MPSSWAHCLTKIGRDRVYFEFYHLLKQKPPHLPCFSKSQLSMALTGSFITYGAGQLVSGVLGEPISPKKLIFLGLSLTVLMNLCIPFCRNPYQMLVVWCFNGFAQSFLWPPLISFWGWRTVFFFSAICGIIMILVWNRYCEDAPVISIENASIQGSSQKNSFLSPLLLCIMLTIVLQGMLRDEVTTWMPSYISETYHLSHAAAVLTGVLLPLFGLLCIQAASTLYIRKFSNPLSCAGVFFFTGTLSSLALFCSTGKNAAFSVFFSALLTGCMHGVNLIQVCMIPPFFKKQGNVSTVSGVLNSCTYIGSATSTYGIAVLSDRIGWSSTLLIWVLLTFAGTLICIACARPWRKKFL